MSNIILTSDGIDSKEIYDEIKQHIDFQTNVAFITTAKDEKENANGPQKTKQQFLTMGAKCVDFVDLEFQNPQILFNYDVIFLGGGNPFRLMYWIRKSKAESVFQKLYNENKIIIGLSAGSMVLGEYFGICQYLTPEQNTFNMTDLSGLKLCKVNICPHYNSFPNIFEDCDEKLKRCEKDNNVMITKIYDGHAIVIENNVEKKIGGKVISL